MATLGAEPGVLRAVRRQRPRTGTASTPSKALFLNHVLDQPADRPRQAGARGRGRLRPRRQRARRRHRRQRREDARDRLGAHARDVRRPEQRGAASRRARPRTTRSSSSRRWTRRARSSLCRAVLRGRRASRRSTTRSPAASTRTTRSSIFDNAFIPWENVLVYRDVEQATGFYAQSGFFNRYTLQSGTRLGVKLDFMCRAARAGPRANGTDGFRGVQATLGELVGWRNLIWALTTALCHEPQPGPGGSVVPKLEYADADPRSSARRPWPRSRAIFADDPGRRAARDPVERRGPAVRRAAPADRPLLPRLDRRRPRADQALQAHLGRDRHASSARATSWYETQLQRQPRADAARHARFARRTRRARRVHELVEQCMSDYDLDGWTATPGAADSSTVR